MVCLTLACAVLSAFVLFASLCRLAPMHVRTHKPVWIAVFLAFGIGAMVSLYEIVDSGASWSMLLWGSAAALYLIGSRDSWRDGTPRYFCKGAQ